MKKILGLIALCLFFFNPIFAEERSETEVKNGILLEIKTVHKVNRDYR